MEESYGEFCTRGAWRRGAVRAMAPFVGRELFCGSQPFSDLHRGVPRTI
jgi:hypothetical protein